MTLAETYANACGVKVGNPVKLPGLYFPTPTKYITIHAGSGMQSKNYDYFQEVVNSIGPALAREGIAIIQIGLENEPRLIGPFCLNGATNLYQCSYIVERSLLHIGNDSIWIHYAGACKVPCVGLYGPTLASVCGPYHRGKFIPIQSDLRGQKPSYSDQEYPKTINHIKPESVSNAAFELLGFDDRVSRESLFFGERYQDYVIEYIPNFLVKNQMPPNVQMNIRMDKFFHEQALADILVGFDGTLDIFTDRPIHIGLLNQFRNKINCVHYKLAAEGVIDPTFTQNLHHISLNYDLFTDEEDEEQLSRWRFEFFDYKIIRKVNKKTKLSVENNEKVNKNTYVKTRRQVLASGKSFQTFAHWKQNAPSVNNENTTQVGCFLDSPSFWEESDYFYIYN
jgi:hypothetical protein